MLAIFVVHWIPGWLFWVLTLACLVTLIGPCVLLRGRRLAWCSRLSVLFIAILLAFWVRDRNGVEWVRLIRNFKTEDDMGYEWWSVRSEAGRLNFELKRIHRPHLNEAPGFEDMRFDGAIGFTWSWEDAHTGYTVWTHSPKRPSEPLPKRLGFDGISIESRNGGQTVTTKGLYFPSWAAALIFAIPPAIWLAHRPARRRKSRLDHGLCMACGYNLMGTPPKEDATRVCSECGAVNPAAQPAQLKPELSEIPAKQKK